MSKGSLFFGHATGKLGQVVLSNVKGQQIARAWQPKVANPRTTVQQVQRAKFANAVKFYKRATQNLFKFAYEDKRKTESDYNAFMRHNTDVPMIVNRAQYLNASYPALGNEFLLSSGSLGSVTCQDLVTPEIQNGCVLSSPYVSTPATYQWVQGATIENVTIAEVSKYFIHDFMAQEGDIITFVGIEQAITSIDAEPTTPPYWSICQFVVNTSNAAKFKEFMDKQAPNSIKLLSGDGREHSIYMHDGEVVLMMGVIISRVTSNGVLVSVSNLANNAVAYKIYSDSLKDSYRTPALVSWGRSSDPILKGSLAKQAEL